MSDSTIRENIVTVKAFVRRGRALLMIRHENGRWDLPGGRMDIPESIGDTLRREIREELGVEIASADFDHPWVWYWEHRSTSRPLVQNIVGIGYSCELASDELKYAPPEHVEHAWVTAEQLRELNMHEGHRAGYLRWFELQGLL
ncbi:MAG: NUDIX domain-containing protein [bacterium]|nr:NUDIX domain-containing protein [bacterium]